MMSTSDDDSAAHEPHHHSLLPPRSILKKQPSMELRRTQIRWDEANLMLTEADRGTRMRIDEPKTPYVPYAEEDRVADLAAMEELDDLAGFELSLPASEPDGESKGRQRLRKAVRYGSSGGESAASSGSEGAQIILGVPGQDWGDADSDDDGGEPPSEEARKKHDQFLALRSQHYNMRQALQHAQELMSEDEEAEGNADSNMDDDAPPPVPPVPPIPGQS